MKNDINKAYDYYICSQILNIDAGFFSQLLSSISIAVIKKEKRSVNIKEPKSSLQYVESYRT